jgi:hypothetical protein
MVVIIMVHNNNHQPLPRALRRRSLEMLGAVLRGRTSVGDGKHRAWRTPSRTSSWPSRRTDSGRGLGASVTRRCAVPGDIDLTVQDDGQAVSHYADRGQRFARTIRAHLAKPTHPLDLPRLRVGNILGRRVSIIDWIGTDMLICNPPPACPWLVDMTYSDGRTPSPSG